MIKLHIQKDHLDNTRVAIVNHSSRDGSWSWDSAQPDFYLELSPAPHWERVVEGAHLDVPSFAPEAVEVHPDLPPPLADWGRS